MLEKEKCLADSTKTTKNGNGGKTIPQAAFLFLSVVSSSPLFQMVALLLLVLLEDGILFFS